MPRWLLLLLLGTAGGAAAVLFVQQRLLPPRLTPAASAELRGAFDQADAARLRLQAELNQTQQRLQTTLAERQALSAESANSRAMLTRLQEDLAAVVAALPPDPRDGQVAVRAARFNVKGGQLNYEVVLSRERAGSKPLLGTLKLLVAGESGKGSPSTVTPQAIPLQVGSHEVVSGSVPLPEGFTPRQTTIQVLDRSAGRSLGMRVLPVK
ncbi:MAG: hypothetical protein Q8M96_15175 [Rubrivivax sp.]|nr:hypothetical protein [Rubrivivax sp.]